MARSLTYVEIDIPAFTQNSPPDPEITMRFALDNAYLPSDIDAIPSIKEVELSPAIISLGENLGQRATLTVTFNDHKHIFSGESVDSGTFWGKFRARYGLKLRGRPIRFIRGLLGDALADMENRHYVIESTDGPTPDGEYKIIAKDLLKFADADRAQAPLLSNGFLVADITAVATTATLSPAGIGNTEYPASGHVAIGGSEIASFTRAADVLTLTRGLLGTVAATHNAQDRVQIVLRYVGADVANIIQDLLVTYSGVDAANIPLSTWLTETSAFLGVLYTATIGEPTSVNTLISELVEQAALALWWDDSEELIRLQVLRSISTLADSFTEDNTLEDTLEIREQPDKRISQIYTYFAKINPLLKQDQIENYRSTARIVDAAAELDYGGAVIKKIFSRWIPAGGRSIADRLNEIQLGRYVDPPRRFNFHLMKYAGQDPLLGTGYRLAAWPLQDITGASDPAPIQITRLNPEADRFEIEAEEMLFTAADPNPGTRTIIFDSNVNNINLRTIHDSLYPAPVFGNTINAYVNAGVIIGSISTSLVGFDIGSWPAGVTINLTVEGRLQGRGGDGGDQAASSQPGDPGGIALYTRYAINLDVDLGEIFGGAGGGGMGGGGGLAGAGGGGAGQNPGDGGTSFGGSGTLPGSPGTSEAGGAGSSGAFSGGVSGGAGGNGGGPGLAGNTGVSSSNGIAGGAGGSPGSAIDGVSFVTVTAGPGDIRGPQVS